MNTPRAKKFSSKATPRKTWRRDYVSRTGSISYPLEALTPRQREILQLVAEGHTSKEIAQRLDLSHHTVEAHRNQLMKRLGVHDLAGLVRFAIRVGLIGANG